MIFSRSTSIRAALRRRLTRALPAVALALAVAACGDSTTVVIGLAGPFSESRGLSMKRAAEMAVAEVNRAGGLGGRRLELLILDDSARASRAITVADSLRGVPAVVAVIGHLNSAATIAAAAIYNSGSDPVVELSPSASSPDVAGIGPWTFRVCASDLAHGTALAQHTALRLGVRSVAVIYENDDYGRGVMTTFRAEFARQGGTITEQDPVLGGATDPTPYIERIQREGRAGAILVAADRVTAVRVLRTMQARGLDLPVMGGDALTGIQDDGTLGEGVFISRDYLPEQPGARNETFVRAYQAAFGGERPDHRGAGAYDAVHLIAAAVRARGARRDAVREYLASIGTEGGPPPYQGVTGTIEFNDQGEVRSKGVIVGVARRGRIVPAEAR